jgi:hypothetical protein
MRHFATVLLLTPVCAPPLCAQSERRDTVTLTSGEVLYGRVVQRYEPEALVLDQDGSRRKIPHARVASVRTVADDVAEWLDLRREGLSVAAEWSLAEAACSRGLEALARLQAYHVLLRDPEHALAHALLGHVATPGKNEQRWRWRFDEGLVSPATFARRAHSERFTLHSEHFTLESRSGLRIAVDTLFDLERTYAAFWRELGRDLHPRSLFPRIAVFVHPSLHDLPKLSTTMSEPYCDPTQRSGGAIHTYVEGTMDRPFRLAAVTIEQLLYRTLLDPRAVAPVHLDQRFAPWVEVGLGRFYDARGSGSPGYLAFGKPKLDPLLVGQVLRYRPYGLENFVHVVFTAFHEDPVVAPFHIAHAAMLVTYLMDDQSSAGTPLVALRPRFLAFVRACFHDGKGSGSSLLDDALGKEIGRVENLEAPWIAWLAKASGQNAQRHKHNLRPSRSLRDRVLGPLIR